MTLENCVQVVDDETRLHIIVRPGARMDGVTGVDVWRSAVQVKVRDPAVKGRANKAVEHLLASALDTKVAIISGHTASQKVIRVELRPEELLERLKKLVS